MTIFGDIANVVSDVAQAAADAIGDAAHDAALAVDIAADPYRFGIITCPPPRPAQSPLAAVVEAVGEGLEAVAESAQSTGLLQLLPTPLQAALNSGR